MNRYFGGFIMTFERENILKSTIESLFSQTLPPERLWIIDNSISLKTKELIEALSNPKIIYHRVGYNSGPAGAAKIGLELLTKEGYKWIYWGDDDDPPKSDNCFESLISNGVLLDKPGILGAVGHRLDRSFFEINRTSDKDLIVADWVKVDVIAGNMCMIVNSEVIRAGALPDCQLFFGFEELDFCLQVQEKGFNLWANCYLFKHYRMKSKRPLIRAGRLKQTRKFDSLWREYYSARNTMFIIRRQRLLGAGFYIFCKYLLKSIYGFKFGIKYGYWNFKYILLGLFDFLINRRGNRSFS